jgi:hypothetical protein
MRVPTFRTRVPAAAFRAELVPGNEVSVGHVPQRRRCPVPFAIEVFDIAIDVPAPASARISIAGRQ